jgi:hypothetical protein
MSTKFKVSRQSTPLNSSIKTNDSSTKIKNTAEIPQISTQLSWKDRFDGWKVRWDIGRMDYTVNPCLYAIGSPDKSSPVLVTANYKLTFDTLRKELAGQNLWIMVLNTFGVNVWCAAGKGTFSTDELVKRIRICNLESVVIHHNLILPQLGAPGISVHAVKCKTGFKVIYGPVHARDIPEFLKAGNVATKEMRKVQFTAWDRLVLTPVELVTAFKTLLPILGVIFILVLIGVFRFESPDFVALIVALLSGAILTPLLLPYIPGKAFAWKGWLVGTITNILTIGFYSGFFSTTGSIQTTGIMDIWRISGWLLFYPMVSAFLAMNFTGTSTYTSFSGVVKEMGIAVPIMAIGTMLGIVAMFIGNFA